MAFQMLKAINVKKVFNTGLVYFKLLEFLVAHFLAPESLIFLYQCQCD